MSGIIKKFDARGFGIIDGADGRKVPFILSDFDGRGLPRSGQRVVFSVRRVKGQVFANNIAPFRKSQNAA